MMNKKVTFIWVLLWLSAISVTSGQTPQASCGVAPTSMREKLEYKAIITRKRLVNKTNTEKVIPVVFHILDNDGAPSIAELEQALEAVNEGFANTGAFATDYGIDSNITFCLASVSPDGGVTNGVNYVRTSYENFDVDLELSDFLSHSVWDLDKYLNVWIANGIRAEHPILTLYSGEDWWSRPGLPAFAMPGFGIVLTDLNTDIIIHELGHFFGLLHTFEGFMSEKPCKNDDCLLDGDLVCDTPPDKSVFNSCGDNSCNTDTLSNYSNQIFFTDTLDMGSNFMDYGNCPIEFSHGQIDRMHFIIEDSYPNLSNSGLCTNSCDAISAVRFEVDKELIIANESVSFNIDEGIFDNYEWSITSSLILSQWVTSPDGANLVSSSSTLNHSFSNQGWYTVHLKAWNDSDPSCYTSYSRNVFVTCSVDARFSPDKRKLASKQPNLLFTDSITFINYSEGATDYEWSVNFTSRETGEAFPEFKSSDEHLTYLFTEPGDYFISLMASNSSCIDISSTFQVSLIDPTQDGSPLINSVSCFNTDSILVNLTLFNFGFDTIKTGTPISFYNGNPQSNSGEVEFLEAQKLNKSLAGFEEIVGQSRTEYTFYVAANYGLIETLFVVYNDTGTTSFPIAFPKADQNVLTTNSEFPASGVTELDYSNNFNSYTIPPPEPIDDIYACIGEILTFTFESNICWDSVVWESSLIGKLDNEPIRYEVVDTVDAIVVSTYTLDKISFTDTFKIFPNKPELSIQENVYRIQRGESVQLRSEIGAYSTIEWTPASTLNDSSVISPIASPLINTVYTATATDTLGCVNTAQITVYVNSSGFIPNLFSPNGDNRNDRLLVFGMEGVEELSFKILNRAGNLMYSTNNADELRSTGWDGKWNGQIQPPGAYYWQIDGQYVDGVPITLNNERTGVIHLVR